MVRKQLYITAEQERALKASAKAEGKSEAGVVRDALVAYLTRTRGTGLHRNHASTARELVEANGDLSRNVSFGKNYVFDRMEGYEERSVREPGPDQRV